MKIENPSKVIRTYTQKIKGTPAQIFPLLCPVREKDWIDGWDPEIVYSDSGIAEKDCVFVTYIGGKKTVWVITRYEPENNFTEMIRYNGDTLIVKLSVTIAKTDAGSDVNITYTYTAVNDEGKREIEAFTQQYYDNFMKEWEENMNHYLLNGTCRKK